MKLLFGGPQEFRHRTNFLLVVTGMVLLVPFTVNNFLQGRLWLGLGTMLVVMVMCGQAWLLYRRRSSEMLALFALVPAILIALTISIQEQGIGGILWSYVAMMAFFLILSERNAIAASVVLALIVTPQAAMVLESGLAVRAAVTLVAVGLFGAIFVHAVTEAQRELQRQATTDSLTGLLNRTTLMDSIIQSIEQFHRNDTPMTLLACDIDHFKRVNDELGHPAGDDVLGQLGKLLSGRFRRVDKIFRTGGEEFLVILNGSDFDTVRTVAEELRATVERYDFGVGRGVTVSVGVATLEDGDDADAWLERADEHLYEAKRKGRNRIVARASARQPGLGETRSYGPGPD